MSPDNYTRRLENFIEISRKLSASIELDAFLQEVVKATKAVIDAEESSILVYHEGTRCLRFIAGPWYEFDLMEPILIPLEGSIAGWVYTHAQPLAIDNASQDARVFRGVDRALNFETAALIAVPMIYKNQTLGVLEAVNQKNARHYNEEDVTFMELLAFQAALVIKNSQMLKKAQKECEEADERDRLITDLVGRLVSGLHAPLGQILGYASLLGQKATPEQLADVQSIVKNAEVIKEMLDAVADPEDIALKITRQRRTTRK
jgi:signal transduction protein with GAF and PtsI domain